MDVDAKRILDALITCRGKSKTKDLLYLLDEVNRQLRDNELR